MSAPRVPITPDGAALAGVPREDRLVVFANVVASLALALWFGGLATVVAVVVPAVFRNVPEPHAAEVVTLVFRRLDGVAMVASIVVLAREAWFASTGRATTRLDATRAALGGLAALTAVVSAAYLAPRIEALHCVAAVCVDAQGGVAPATLHRLAETNAKIELALVATVLAMTIAQASSTRRPSASRGPSRD